MDSLRLDPEAAKEINFLKIEHQFENMDGTVKRISEDVSGIKHFIETEVKDIRNKLNDWQGNVNKLVIDMDKRVTENERTLREAKPCFISHEQVVGGWVIKFLAAGVGAALMFVFKDFFAGILAK